MSELLFTVAQIVFVLWPLFILTALAYSFQGRLTWSAFSRRVRESLLATWVVLFFVWLFTLFAPLPTPGIFPEPWNTLVFLGGFALLLLGEASRLGLLRHRLRARVELRHNPSLHRLKNMDPYDFEYLVAETYQSLGYQTKHVGHSGDHGVDVTLHAPDGKKWIVQCKRYDNTVGESVIRELYGTMVSEKGDRAALVTTAQITTPAREWARGKPIELIDGPAFLKMMAEAHRRSQGTFLERLSVWFEKLLEPGVPPGLRVPVQTQPNLSNTQPVRVRPTSEWTATDCPASERAASERAAATPVSPAPAILYNNGAPVCPNCGIPMVPRPAQTATQPGRILYRCRNYPRCRIVLEPRQPN